MFTYTGDALLRESSGARALPRRDLMGDLDGFLDDTRGEPCICALYGIRRTGKTTMMLQAAGEREERSAGSCAYVICTAADDMQGLFDSLADLEGAGARFVFVDEITAMEDFSDLAAPLADGFARGGLRVVIAGTDSLAIRLSEWSSLYDRCLEIRTTEVPYAEFARLTGLSDVDSYIEHGGLLLSGSIPISRAPHVPPETLSHYVDTAIASNIQRSLAFYREGSELWSLREPYESGELTDVIQRIVQMSERTPTLAAIRRAFKPYDLGAARANAMRRRADDDWLVSMGPQERRLVTDAVARAVGIVDRSSKPLGLTGDQLALVERYLVECDVMSRQRIVSPGVGSSEYLVLRQPGMRWAFATETVSALESTGSFQSIPARARERVMEEIDNVARGVVLEDIVLSEAVRDLSSDDVSVVKIRKSGRAGELSYEYDMAVVDRRALTVDLFEIKHSSTRVPGQARHLLDSRSIDDVERYLGKVISRSVVYRGQTSSLDGVAWLNVEDFLIELSKSRGARVADVVGRMADGRRAPDARDGEGAPTVPRERDER